MAAQAILIGGTASGVGKTSICLGIVRALARRGLRVQSFKVGPDYLDPTYLALASGRPCYNLDPWMSSESYARELFARRTADAVVAVIEGVMGLFDGADAASLDGSSAHVAKLLDVPVWLVVNAHGMSRSLAALVRGYSHFEQGVRIAGVIANQAGSQRHVDLLRDALGAAGEVPLLGAISRGALPELHSRHLGLKTASSKIIHAELLDRLADAVEAGIPALRDLPAASRAASPDTPRAGSGCTAQSASSQPRQGRNAVAHGVSRGESSGAERSPGGGDTAFPTRLVSPLPGLARTAGNLPAADAVGYCLPPLPGLATTTPPRSSVPATACPALTLAIAYDDAFHFYYADNLDALQAAGCNIVRFSPLADAALPSEADALYLGGGYPEEFARELEANAAMRQSIAAFAASGRVVYAECGGLMYLTEAIEPAPGQSYRMCSVLPGICRMGQQRKRLGYGSVSFLRDCAWGAAGEVLRGHEFHYSEHVAGAGEVDGWQRTYHIQYRRGEESQEGWHKGNVMASYVHLHWASRPAAVRHFVQAIRKAGGCGR